MFRSHSSAETAPRESQTMGRGTVFGTDTCSGACCKAFTLTESRRNIVLTLQQLADGAEEIKYSDGSSRPLGKDKRQIFEMVVPLGNFLSHPFEGTPYVKRTELWTCKNFDPESKLCRIYDDRPMMCSGYPKNGCEYDSCTWVGNRRPTHPALAVLR